MKRSLTHGAGYLVIDHSQSPGLSPDDLPTMPGLAIAGGEVFERDVLTCAHCQRAIVLNPSRTRPRHYCGKCDHYICDNPICVQECQPIRKLFDQTQTRAEHAPAGVSQIVMTDKE